MVSQDLEQRIFALSADERHALMLRLHQSLNCEGHRVDPAWLSEELRRRKAEAEAHPEQSITVDEMREKLAKRFGWNTGS